MLEFLKECLKQFRELGTVAQLASLVVVGLVIPTLWQYLVTFIVAACSRLLGEPSWKSRVIKSFAGNLYLFHKPLIAPHGEYRIVASRLRVCRRFWRKAVTVSQIHIKTGKVLFAGSLHVDTKNAYIVLCGTNDTDHKTIVVHLPSDHHGVWCATGTMAGINDQRDPYAVRIVLTRNAFAPEILERVLLSSAPIIARYKDRDTLHTLATDTENVVIVDESVYVPSLSDASPGAMKTIHGSG